jgi:hypothetical protein
MAMTRLILFLPSRSPFSGTVTTPFRPQEPSSVVEYQFVAHTSHPVLPEEDVPASRPSEITLLPAFLSDRASGIWEQRPTAANADHGSEFLDMGWDAERADKIQQRIAGLKLSARKWSCPPP